MNRWLIKSDPDEYSAADLARDGKTDWTGVTNAVAQKHLAAMKPRDPLLIYHTGKEKAIVATGQVATAPRPTPGDKSGKLVTVDVAFGKWVKKPVELKAIKDDPFFADFALVRIGRLSVMPVTDEQWTRLLKMAGGESAQRPV